MSTTATNFLRSGDRLIPIGFDTTPSILAELLQRETRKIQEANDADDTIQSSLIARQYAAAIATVDISTKHTISASDRQCTNKHCPYRLYRRGKNGKQLIAGPVVFCTGCD